MISLLIFLFILGLLIIVHEFGHFIIAKKLKVRVEEFSLGFGPQLIARKKGQTRYSLSAIPLGGYVKLAGDNLEEYKGSPDEYLARPPRQRALIIFFGPLLNYAFGFFCFWMVFFVGYPTLTTKVGGLLDGFGAKAAGVHAGDKIIAIDGEKTVFWEDIQKVIRAKGNAETVQLTVLRASKEHRLEVGLKQKELDDVFGEKKNTGILGITVGDEIVIVRHGFVASFFLGLKKTYDLTLVTYLGLWRMVTGKLSLRDSVTGPLGIFLITSKVAQLGFIAVLHFLAVLSISLAIFNLLPLPILDGGHLLFLAIEKIRGKYLSLKAEQVVTRIGLTLIITLAILVTYNDVLRHFGDKISKLRPLQKSFYYRSHPEERR